MCPAAEETFDAAMQDLVARGYLGSGQLVTLVMSGRKPIWRSASTHSIQVEAFVFVLGLVCIHVVMWLCCY